MYHQMVCDIFQLAKYMSWIQWTGYKEICFGCIKDVLMGTFFNPLVVAAPPNQLEVLTKALQNVSRVHNSRDRWIYRQKFGIYLAQRHCVNHDMLFIVPKHAFWSSVDFSYITSQLKSYGVGCSLKYPVSDHWFTFRRFRIFFTDPKKYDSTVTYTISTNRKLMTHICVSERGESCDQTMAWWLSVDNLLSAKTNGTIFDEV